MSSPIERVFAVLLDREYQREIFGDLPGFERKGTGYIARCPFHDDIMPTMVIYGDRPEYFCFVCSSRGDWLSYLKEKHGRNFQDALVMVEQASGLGNTGYTEALWKQELDRSLALETCMGAYIAGLWSPPGQEVLHYLYARGYATGEVKGMSVGYFPGHDKALEYLLSEDVRRPGLVIPYRDASGRLMGLMYKDIEKHGPESYAPLTTLQGLDDVPFLLYRSRGQRDVIVVEGVFDSLLLDQLRLKPVIGIGDRGLSTAMIKTACGYGCSHFILALGNGERQKTCTASAIKLIHDHGAAASVLPVPLQYKDIDEFIRMTCLDHYKALLKKAIPGGKWLGNNP